MALVRRVQMTPVVGSAADGPDPRPARVNRDRNSQLRVEFRRFAKRTLKFPISQKCPSTFKYPFNQDLFSSFKPLSFLVFPPEVHL
jgi:hypothetical protein